MSDTTTMNGGSAFGTAAACRSRDCCASCAFWLESTVYCPGGTDRLLAA